MKTDKLENDNYGVYVDHMLQRQTVDTAVCSKSPIKEHNGKRQKRTSLHSAENYVELLFYYYLHNQ